MPKASEVLYYLVHPQELRSIVQWKVWHNPVHERDEAKECESLKQCFKYLKLTSRSFSAIIQELNPELLVPICLFYLVLRGLDTIEDDMTIPLQTKEPLLRQFDQFLEQDGWTFNGNGPAEKDRELLVNFHYVVTEFKKIPEPYQVIIKDITKKMGDGMADYADNAEHNVNGVNTVKDYELYCHYVAGLVGEGLTRLFVQGNLANPALLKRPELSESMGQFLQQINIIRDIKEDLDDGRRFWPKEIWSKHVNEFEDLFKPENKEKALNCSSEMVLTALRRADDCLFYLAGIKDQSVFNFCAIPQSMAIATMELCFRNHDIFKRNVKITKGQACQLMLSSTQNLSVVCDVFRDYARKIHHKNDPKDPNYLEISIACAKIEQFIESIFPTQKPTGRPVPADEKSKTPATIAKEKAEAEASKWDMIYMGGAVMMTLAIISGFMIFIAWLAGARFDMVFDNIKDGLVGPTGIFAPGGAPSPTADAAEAVLKGHSEL